MYIASSSTTVKFHEFPDGNLLHNYQPGTKVDGPVRSISWSKDGCWLSLVPESGLAEIISLREQLKLVHTIADVKDPSCTAFQNTTKKIIAFGTKNGQVLLYDIKAKRIKEKYPKAPSLVSHLQYAAKDTHLIAGCQNGDVILYSSLINDISATLRVPNSESLSALRANPSKRNFLAGGSDEGIVVVWDTNVNKHKFFVTSHKAQVTGVAFSPINSDLIISTGSDRQICCYDTNSNKCIARMPVDNSMTAVDFSWNGTHFVTASQNGNICLYDSRRIQEPILTFEAHKSTIKSVLFQKNEIVKSNSHISEDEIVVQAHQDQGEAIAESFSSFIPEYEGDHNLTQKSSASSMSVQDSFLVALGLNNKTSNTKEENALPNSPYLEESRKDFPIEGSQLSINKILLDKLGINESRRKSIANNSRVKHMSSTPNLSQKNTHAPIDVSPVLHPKLDLANTEATNEIKDIIQKTVRKEVETISEAVCAEVKYQAYSNFSQMRRMFLDMQMSMIKEFIKLENNLNNLREDMASGLPVSENYLIEENLKLKKQIELLEDQLAAKCE